MVAAWDPVAGNTVSYEGFVFEQAPNTSLFI